MCENPTDFGSLKQSNPPDQFCPACNYNLAGHLAPATCPECGFEINSAYDHAQQQHWSPDRIVGRALWPPCLVILGILCTISPPLIGARNLWWVFWVGVGAISLGLIMLTWTTRRALYVVFGKKPRHGDGVARAVLRQRGELKPMRQSIFWLAIIIFGGFIAFCFWVVHYLQNFKI